MNRSFVARNILCKHSSKSENKIKVLQVDGEVRNLLMRKTLPILLKIEWCSPKETGLLGCSYASTGHLALVSLIDFIISPLNNIISLWALKNITCLSKMTRLCIYSS